jgi:hypothetical protein
MTNYTQHDLKLAHQIVSEDLFNSLAQLQAGQSLRLGHLGKFTKSEHSIKSALFKKELGKDYQFIYAKISFKPFSKLKELLTNQVLKKYRLRKKKYA